jgi:hypothetical protein
MSIRTLLILFLDSLFKSQRQLVLENLALRQQVTMLWQSVKRPRATAAIYPNPFHPTTTVESPQATPLLHSARAIACQRWNCVPPNILS